MIGNGFVNSFSKAFRFNGFDKIINSIYLITIKGIFCISSSENNKCLPGDGTGKLNTGNTGHLNIQKDKINRILFHETGSRHRAVESSHKIEYAGICNQQFHRLSRQWFIIYNNTIHKSKYKITV